MNNLQRYQIRFIGSPEDEIAQILEFIQDRSLVVMDIISAYEMADGNNLHVNTLAVDFELKWFNIALTEEQRDTVIKTGLFIEKEPESISGSPLAEVFPVQDANDGLGNYSNQWAWVENPNSRSSPAVTPYRLDHYNGGTAVWNVTYNLATIIGSNGLSPKIINPSLYYMGHTKLWEEGYQGEGIRIGVIDTGATVGGTGTPYPNITDVPVSKAYNSTLGGIESVDHFHAWGRISQIAANGKLLGGAPKSQIYSANYSNVPMALKWCIDNGCNVINCSFAAVKTSYTNDLLKDFKRRGGHVVVSAGNSSTPDIINGLASSPGAIAVGSLVGGAIYKIKAQPLLFSILPLDGNGIDFMAPNFCLSASTWSGQNTDPAPAHYIPYDGGTSTSAAYITALLGLLVEKYPYLSSEARENMLRRTSTPVLGGFIAGRYQ